MVLTVVCKYFYVAFILMNAECQVFIQSTMYLLKSLSWPACQILNIHRTRKLAPSTVAFLVSCQLRFHAALFKDQNLYPQHTTRLMSPKKDETAVHCCDPAISVLVMLAPRNVFHVVSTLQSLSPLYIFSAD